ncbi:putative tyrosyl-tRNA synthetase [Trypanosoma cruzi]|uniref:tyrosine--tRNA ligase n=2 Tax=Trypanosoma cruzi TaxID=5693 RepID=Q4DSP6_TRYCC|nr:tyrosyl-tRNA synthetase, putative [Trypanosoma cruzi]EAN95560.1 tyrosyl-tRNA synthetase, putative [Trypanosoma cruzi]PWV14466.1 putative tyrosyl-tRNA synthetase [Trypanosoma cruzi]RNC46416.1 tyrosyl-tRNA synthetase putative (TyrS) [Trypanosoma cruzi]|eukprot:XP_817411.1 tyrosyl-tRNA synthetase [Trypanosoma cruzi strain CL Brener]
MTAQKPTEMTTEERYALVRSVGEECIQEEELLNLITKKPNIRCYDGFEPSGRMHIAQGVFKAVNVNKCTQSGCEFVFWVADWFALMNDKMCGELEKIRIVGQYLIEVWKAAGMNMEKVIFLWSSDEITRNANSYWKTVLDIGRRNTIARIKKCCTIMGKQEGTLTAAQILYPLMQCADIFFLKADICQLGLDQRKVNMLAREYCDLIGRKLKPVILSHHMLSGLKEGQPKMSKSDPDSAIFMEDTREDVERKIRHAYCPRLRQKKAEVPEDGAPVSSEEKNPVLDYFQHVIYSRPAASTTINGTLYKTYEELEEAFVDGTITEELLKDALALELNALLEPVRHHFACDPHAAGLLEKVKSFRKGGQTPPLTDIGPFEQSETPLAVVWLPTVIKLSVNVAVAISDAVKAFLEQHSDGEVVLLLPEWTAFSCGEVTGEEKNISAALELNLALLQATYLRKEWVRVVRQSQLILDNPNDYWVAAINAGRRNMLQYLGDVCGEFKAAGDLVAALMYVADVAMLKATHIISAPHERGYHEVVKKFFDGRVTAIPAREGTVPPLHRPEALVAGADDVLFLDDTDMDTRRKIKKAYCAPNEAANPVLSIAAWLLRERGTLTVERAAENGGNVAYTSEARLRDDAQSGTLHPADLKAAVTKPLLEVCAVSKAVLSSAEGKKLSQTLRQAEKTLSKRSK